MSNVICRKRTRQSRRHDYPNSAAPMSSPAARFQRDDLVRRKNQPEAVGVVRKSRWNSQTEEWEYSVQFGGQLRAVPESVIEAFQQIETPWEALSRGQLSGIDHFVFTLTLHRLRQPPARIAHSFATARTLFYPHQFKPLLKFLRAPSRATIAGTALFHARNPLRNSPTSSSRHCPFGFCYRLHTALWRRDSHDLASGGSHGSLALPISKWP